MHNPEFTSMEIYVCIQGLQLDDGMTEDVINTIANEVLGTTDINYDGKNISLQKPFKREKMFDLFKKYIGKDIFGASLQELLQIAEENKVELPANAPYSKIIDEIFSELVQPNLIHPTFVMDYPIEISPLAKSIALKMD